MKKAFKSFGDRDGIMNLNNMVIAMKELKLNESEAVISEIESENKK